MGDDIIVLETAAQRIDAILSGRPGVILLDSSRMRTDETVNAYPYQANFLRESAVHFIVNNASVIHQAATQNKISEDLLKAVIYLETSHSIQDVPRSAWVNKTLTPANANAHIWGKLLGYTEHDMLDPAKNIELAARVLAELQARLVYPSAAAIATLYNSTSQDVLTAYGMEVAIYMVDKPWLKDPQKSPTGPDITGFPIDFARCFPAHTRIQTSRTTFTAISALRVGDVVLAFDSRVDKGRGALVPRRVTRLYRNTTTEWIRLRWQEDGTAREMITTPGHHFLDKFGQFPTIEEMVIEGRATVVLASGELAEMTADRILFSTETAHLFERATSVGMIAGNTALKPAKADAWQTYNFEVEDLHTYVAEGVRVHNNSGWFGAAATQLLSPGNDGNGYIRGPNGEYYVDASGHLIEGRHVHEGLVDTVLDAATNLAHGIGTVVNGIIDTFAEAGRELVGDFSHAGKAGQYYADPVHNFDAETHQKFVENTLATSDGWSPPPGYTVVPNGGGFSIVKSDSNGNPVKDPKTGDYISQNPNANGTWNGGNNEKKDSGGGTTTKPILLDLNGNGVEIVQFDRSTIFLTGEDGLKHKTAWAGVGDGVLFYEPLRVCRRLIDLSYAAMGSVSRAA